MVGVARELVSAPFHRFICPVGDAGCLSAVLMNLCATQSLRLKYGNMLRARREETVDSGG